MVLDIVAAAYIGAGPGQAEFAPVMVANRGAVAPGWAGKVNASKASRVGARH